MNKQLAIGLIAGAGVATALGAAANLVWKSNGERPTPSVAVAEAPPADAEGQRMAAALPAAEPGVKTRSVESTAPAVAAPARAAPARTTAAPRVSAARYAEVVGVQPVSKTVSEPREVCHDEQVVKQAPVKDEHRVAGTLLGAAIGGVVGHQIGDGDGQKIARVAGVVAGGYAGNRIQNRMQEANTVTTTEQRCETVYEQRAQPLGYDVTYTYGGKTGTVRMSRDPGPRLPVRDGRVVVDGAAKES